MKMEDIAYSEKNLSQKVLEIGCGISNKMFGSCAYQYGEKSMGSSSELKEEIMNRIKKIIDGNKMSFVSDLNIDPLIEEEVLSLINGRFIEIDILKLDIKKLDKFNSINIRLVIKHLFTPKPLLNSSKYKEIFTKLFSIIEDGGSIYLMEKEFCMIIPKNNFNQVGESYNTYLKYFTSHGRS